MKSQCPTLSPADTVARQVLVLVNRKGGEPTAEFRMYMRAMLLSWLRLLAAYPTSTSEDIPKLWKTKGAFHVAEKSVFYRRRECLHDIRM